MRLDGKVALVTGTSINIGGGIAEGLAAEGAAIVCVDSREANAADCTRYLKSTGARSIAVTCDVTDEGQVASAVKAACDAFDGIDILVNNAAIFNKKGVLDMPLEEWHRQIDRHLDRRISVHQVRCKVDDRAEAPRRDYQHNLDRRASGRTGQHRILHREKRTTQFHSFGRDRAGRTWYSGQ